MNEGIERKEGSIMVPFLVGSLVGAGIALLLAPKSGKELRRDITDAATGTRNKIVSAVERGKEIYAEGTAAVRGAIDAGKRVYAEEREKHLNVV